ncbi:MAG: hydrogenase maturation protease [Acidobacteriota bacterium]
MNVLIAGIGNIFQGDDAFGVEVAQRLARRTLPEGVRAVDFGIRGYDLAYALMEKRDCTILVDAVPRGGAPGTLYVIEPDLSALEAPADVSAHAMDPLNVFRLVKAMGGSWSRVLLLGCEPDDLGSEDEGKMGLSAVVEASVGEAVLLAESLLRDLACGKEIG